MSDKQSDDDREADYAGRSKWLSILKAIDSPLAFFALIVLVINGGLTGYALTSSDSELLHLVAYSLTAIVLMVGGIAFTNPLSLYHPRYWGRRKPNSTGIYVVVGLTISCIGLGYLSYSSTQRVRALSSEAQQLADTKAQLTLDIRSTKKSLMSAILSGLDSNISLERRSLSAKVFLWVNYGDERDALIARLYRDSEDLREEVQNRRKVMKPDDFEEYRSRKCNDSPFVADIALDFSPRQQVADRLLAEKDLEKQSLVQHKLSQEAASSQELQILSQLCGLKPLVDLRARWSAVVSAPDVKVDAIPLSSFLNVISSLPSLR
jgi:hypothetical protein